MHEAQSRVEALQEKMAQEQRRNIEEEAKRLEEMEQADKLMQEATLFVTDVEAKVSCAAEAAAQVEGAAKEGLHESVLKAAQATEELIEVAQIAANEASTSFVISWGDLDFMPVTITKLKNEYRAFQLKITECKRKLAMLGKQAKDAKERENRRAVQMLKDKEQRETFDKYDSDSDGQLNREDVAVFAKTEYFFDLDEP